MLEGTRPGAGDEPRGLLNARLVPEPAARQPPRKKKRAVLFDYRRHWALPAWLCLTMFGPMGEQQADLCRRGNRRGVTVAACRGPAVRARAGIDVADGSKHVAG